MSMSMRKRTCVAAMEVPSEDEPVEEASNAAISTPHTEAVLMPFSVATFLGTATAV